MNNAQSQIFQNVFSKTFFVFFLFFYTFFFGQTKDSVQVNQFNEVLVAATRTTTKLPFSFSNLKKQELEKRNLGQDIPILLNFLPSVVTTSDAGNGVGYTGIRVRGSDATRVNVTINGIPYNDAESHGTYFVNLPDFASSLESIQLQRGVGTSTNGSGAFGASLNLLTEASANKSNGEISNSFGSFNTRKHTVKFGTGLLNNHFELSGRLSNIASNGYINRAKSNLKSYFLQANYVSKSTLIKALLFGGTEKTYQSWNGIDGNMIDENRTYNSAGLFVDSNGNERFYDNETDNYQQDHFQLLWNEKISSDWNTNLAIHYTKGKGYFENYIQNGSFSDYNLQPIFGQTSTDLVRQKWLDNDFFGTTFSANYKSKKVDFIFGGSINKYEGLHFGKVIWARIASNSELGDHYYDNFGIKTDATFYAKTTIEVTKKLNFFLDLQSRSLTYKAKIDTNFINEKYLFFNPKAGISYIFNPKNTFYFSYAIANREPNRTDFENGIPKPENLEDYELGWRILKNNIKINTNFYYMKYQNQLILTGNLDDVGNPIRANSEKSYRLGIEVDATIKISKKININTNCTISQNKNENLLIENQNFGDKEIAYSPNLIAGGILNYAPIPNLSVSFLSKFVGKQYLNNIESDNSQLPGYWINDLNLGYEIKPKSVFNSIQFTGVINNILNKKYISNGYMYGAQAYYYPQAGTNFILGMSCKF